MGTATPTTSTAQAAMLAHLAARRWPRRTVGRASGSVTINSCCEDSGDRPQTTSPGRRCWRSIADSDVICGAAAVSSVSLTEAARSSGHMKGASPSFRGDRRICGDPRPPASVDRSCRQPKVCPSAPAERGDGFGTVEPPVHLLEGVKPDEAEKPVEMDSSKQVCDLRWLTRGRGGGGFGDQYRITGQGAHRYDRRSEHRGKHRRRVGIV